MISAPGASLDMPARSRVLGVMALVAVTLHGAILLSVHWKTPLVAARNTPQQQGIAIDLAPAPLRARVPAPAAPLARQTPPPPVEWRPKNPPPQSAMETDTPRPRIRFRRQAALPAREENSSGMPVQTAQAASGASSAGTASPSGATVDPAPVSEAVNTKPVYPQLARKRGQEGRVLLRVHTNEGGNLTAIDVASGSGFPLLDEAALKAVRTWRFTPALRNGRPVPGTVLVPVEFRLQ